MLAFPVTLNAAALQHTQDTSVSQLVRSFSILFFVAAAIFIVFTPKSLRGAYLGYADPFTPIALGFGALFALVRLKQRHPYDEPHQGEKLLCWPLGGLWLLTVFAAFLWHSDAVACSIGMIQAGRYADAADILDTVIEKDPLNTIALHNRGYARLCLENVDGAIGDFSAVVELEPKNAIAYLMRGIALKKKGQPHQSDFEMFLKFNPNGQSLIDKSIREIDAGIEKGREKKASGEKIGD